MRRQTNHGKPRAYRIPVMFASLLLGFFSLLAQADPRYRVELSVANVQKVETEFREQRITLRIDGRYVGTRNRIGAQIAEQVSGNTLYLSFTRVEDVEALSCAAMARKSLEDGKLALTLQYYSEQHDSVSLSVTGAGYKCGLEKVAN